MNQVITFFFDLWSELLSTIISHWLLSVFFLLTVMGWVVGLINQAKGNGN